MRKRLPKSACVALYLLSIFLDLMTSMYNIIVLLFVFVLHYYIYNLP